MPRSEEFTQKYLTLQECYLNSLPSKLEGIDRHWSVLNNVNWSFEQFQKMHTSVHQLAGSAGGFGLKLLSKEAQTLDGIIFECLRSKTIPDCYSKQEMTSCIKRMYESAGIIIPPKKEIHDDVHADKKILIIDDDPDQTALIELLCAQMHCQAFCCNDLKSVHSKIKECQPDIILMDVVFPEGQFAGIDTFKALGSQSIPVIFMSSRNDMYARLKSYRAGGQGYLTKPFGGKELKVQLDLLDSHKYHHAKVLVIDKEENSNHDLISFLKQEGYHCSYSSNPAVIIHMLERHPPDILILDCDTSNSYSDEILQVLRQETKYMHLPILLMTKNSDTDFSDNAVAHGANGVIHKPFRNKLLLESIQSLVSKRSVLDSIIDRVAMVDVMHESVTRQFFYSLLEKSIYSNTRLNTLTCVSMRNNKQIFTQTGLMHINELNEKIINELNEHLSGNERISKISDLNYALLLSSDHKSALESRLDKMKQSLDAINFKFNIEKFNLESCYAAICLSNESGSVDKVFQKAGDMMFALLQRNDISVQIAHNYQKHHDLSHDEVSIALEYSLDNHTHFLSYQPIIDTNGDEKIFEGFSRIRDEEKNILMPNVFIKHIIGDELKERFNRALIQAAINDLRNLKGLEAEEIQIIVKLLILDKSPIPFLSWVSNLLHSARIRGKNRIIFSISEEDAANNPDKISALHQGVRDLSCSFLLDHAGISNNTQSIIETGHFEYVKLSADKIESLKDVNSPDKKFIEVLLKKKIFIIAPFIEDNATFSSLWKIGIRYFQGYFVRAPEPSLHFDFKIDQNNQK